MFEGRCHLFISAISQTPPRTISWLFMTTTWHLSFFDLLIFSGYDLGKNKCDKISLVPSL